MFSSDSPLIRPAAPYLLVAPTILLIAGVLFYPIVYGVYLSFVAIDPFTGERTFAWFENYAYVFGDRTFSIPC